MTGLCRCGCGQQTKLATQTNRRVGHVQGQPQPFVFGHKPPRLKMPERFWQHVKKQSGCWIWVSSTDKKGYGLFQLPLGSGRYRLMHAHRVAWALANGPIPLGKHICHACDHPSCVRPDHLFMGTHRDNMQDMMAKERQRCGERINTAKLTATAVLDIRRHSADAGIPGTALARQYGVTKQAVYHILHRRHWRHI